MSRFRAFITFSFTVLALSSIAFGAEPPRYQGALKILTLNFNSEDVLADSGGTLRAMRVRAIIDWVHANDPDMIFIQEGWNYKSDPSIAVLMGRELGYDVAYRLDLGVPGVEYDSDAILAKRKFRMSDEQDIKLPHSAGSLGDGKTWIIGVSAASYAIGVKLHLDDGETLYTYTTHLLGDTAQDRADQIQAVVQNIGQTIAADGMSWGNAQIVLGGDFNSTPDEPSVQALLSQGFVDSWATTHPNDSGETFCPNPTQPHFNPVGIGPGLFPSQYDENEDQRIDYVFTHSPDIAPLASTLIFTVPFENAWMTDHYGLFATVGNNPGVSIPNPARDYLGPVADAVIHRITDDDFLCADAWNQEDPGCDKELPEVTVTGPRGMAFIDNSSFYAEISVDGPGHVFTNSTAGIDAGDQTAFWFVGDGDYEYRISNIAQAPNPYRAKLHGVIHVNTSGSLLAR